MRIKTTHVGSLPRGPELTPLLLARDKGEPYDAAAFDRVVATAVDDAVARQVAAGVSVVSDGELGKVGYSTYMIERLSGFGGHIDRKPAADLADAMREEYETIVNAGFTLQLDCPDLAMSRHTGYQDKSEAEFLHVAAANVEALNHATRNIPPEKMRMHVCWGNYEGPHDHDIPLERVIDIVIGARPATVLFEAANPRHEHEWKVWRDAKLPDHKILAPGLIDTCSNYVEHPELIAQRIERFADFVGPERVIASTDCGFGTFAGYGKIDPLVTWRKLANLRAGADIAVARIGVPA